MAIGIIEAVISVPSSELPTPQTKTVAIGEIRSALGTLPFPKATKSLLSADFEDAAKAYHKADRLKNLSTHESARDHLRKASLEDLINHTRAAGCIDGFTDEIAKMVQRCRNSIHPGCILRDDEVFDAFDKKISDLALNFLNVLCSLILKS